MLNYKEVEVYVKDMDRHEIGLWTGDGEPQKGQSAEIDYGVYGGAHEAVILTTADVAISEAELEDMECSACEYMSEMEGQTYFKVYD